MVCMLISFLLTFLIFSTVTIPLDSIGILSLGAIVATFGAALITLADIFEKDRYERIKENISILYEDILHEKAWKRWGFLKRKYIMKLLNNDVVKSELKNPTPSFDVGSHEIVVNLPTVLDDIFDLPVFKDCYTMRKYRDAFMTTCFNNKKEKTKNEMDIFSSFECVYDTLRSACIFRISRCIKEFSIGLIVSSILMVGISLKYASLIGILLG